MQVELAVFEALQSANVSAEKAHIAAEAIVREIDRRYELHSKQLATQSDVAKVETQVAKLDAKVESLRADIKSDIKSLEASLTQQIAASQRWTITVMFAGLAALAALQKLLA